MASTGRRGKGAVVMRKFAVALILVLAGCSGPGTPVTAKVSTSPTSAQQSPTPSTEPTPSAQASEAPSPTPTTAETPHAPPTPSPSPSDWTASLQRVTFPKTSEEYPCRYGFNLGTRDQTMALHAAWRGDGDEVPVEADLPHPEWDVVLLHGTNLFENWCNDVVMQTPQRNVESTWTGVAGRITLKSPPSQGDEYSEVTGTIRGLVVEDEDGQQYLVDDVTIENTNWGCFPPC